MGETGAACRPHFQSGVAQPLNFGTCSCAPVRYLRDVFHQADHRLRKGGADTWRIRLNRANRVKKNHRSAWFKVVRKRDRSSKWTRYVYIYIYIYIHMRLYIYLYIYLSTYLSIYLSIYPTIHILILFEHYALMFVSSMYVCVYVCMCVCMYVFCIYAMMFRCGLFNFKKQYIIFI